MMKSRRMKWMGHIVRMGEKNNAYRLLVGKREGKRPLLRLKRGWVDNIKVDLREIGWGGMDWIYLVHNEDCWRTLMKKLVNPRLP
jgi:hypothetical protein